MRNHAMDARIVMRIGVSAGALENARTRERLDTARGRGGPGRRSVWQRNPAKQLLVPWGETIWVWEGHWTQWNLNPR